MKLIEEYDKNLYKRYKDIETNIKSYSRTIYVSIQAFVEHFIKEVFNDLALEYGYRSSLGKLINDRDFQKYLEREIKFYDLESLYKLNNLGNAYKHDEAFTILEDDIFNILTIVFDLFNKHMKTVKYDIEIHFTKPIFTKLLHFNDNQFKGELVKVKKQKDLEITKLRDQIMLVSKEKEFLVKEAETQQNKQNLIKVSRDKLKAIDVNIDNKTKELISLNKKVSYFRDKEKTDFLTEDEKQKLIKLESEKYTAEDLIDELELKREELEKLVLTDTESRDLNKYKAIINNLNAKITNLENKITNIDVNKIDDEELKTYNSKSIVLDQVRFRYGSNYFKSNYIRDSHFDILGTDTGGSAKTSYESFYAVVYNILTRGSIIKKSSYLIDMDLKEEEYATIYQLQMLLLLLTKEGYLDDDVWKLKIDSNRQYLNIAYRDLKEWIKNIASLAKIDFVMPRLDITDEAKYQVEFNSLNYNEDVFVIRTTGYKESVLENKIWIADNIKYNVSHEDEFDILSIKLILKDIFGFESFKQGQLKILTNFLNGENTIGILPTGGGKSLVFYMSILLQPKVSLIIAPINSLIKDQIDNLNNRFNINRVGNLTSGNENRLDDEDRFKNGLVQFTFASPERVQNTNFRDILIALNYNKTIGSVILDEVHCLSEWGHDFRISYLMLSATLNTYCSNVSYLGLTATASINVVNDLIVELNISNSDNVIFSEKLKRDNLNFKVKTFNNKTRMQEGLKELLFLNQGKNNFYDVSSNKENANSGIIFSRTIGGSGGVNDLYNKVLYPLSQYTGKFYGSLYNRYEQQDLFMNDEKPLLIATKAFGMGIDKPNIRFTIHYGLPSSTESFYQEAGRAGRDNDKSSCLLFTYEDGDREQRLLKTFFSPKTSVSEMKVLADNLKWQTSISTNIFFLTSNLEEPIDETKSTVTLYNKFLSKDIYNQEITKELGKYQTEKNQLEKYLYILHKIGIVNNWSLKYNGLIRVTFYIELNRNYKDIDHIKLNALNYMKEYPVEEHLIAQVKSISSINELDKLILLIRNWYFETFIIGRREQLANIYNFANKYKNKDESDTLQEELDKYFDLSSLIEVTKEGYDLRFNKNTLREVIEFAFEFDESKLEERKINLERLLESYSSNKINIYTALIHLRLDEYSNNKNGKDRFELALSKLNKDEINEVMRTTVNFYNKLDNNNKLNIINSINKYDNNYISILNSKINRCPVLTGIKCQNIINLFNRKQAD